MTRPQPAVSACGLRFADVSCSRPSGHIGYHKNGPANDPWPEVVRIVCEHGTVATWLFDAGHWRGLYSEVEFVREADGSSRPKYLMRCVACGLDNAPKQETLDSLLAWILDHGPPAYALREKVAEVPLIVVTTALGNPALLRRQARAACSTNEHDV